MNRWAFQFFSPIILFCLMLIDGQLSSFFASLFGYSIFPVSHIMLIFLMYSVKQHQLPYLLTMTIVLGIIYDSYFIGVLGIAAALLPLIAMFVNEIHETVFQNNWTKVFTVIIITSIFETLLSTIQIGFHLVELNFNTFVVCQLAPSLILNVILGILLIVPLDILYQDRPRKNLISKATSTEL
ncbi:rod shape-determining protein MreD [Lactovum miscens]|uniref:Rod shape-determining protein MreD n=1 Tax=Lactovum miscens TaxID=190387 RepID=A0A841C826_9LACT|nr:rod shape-determining protein MreD [Lactovum miscens]MBB5888457.1 rod shape-determining protein MreD [Lactovum miscens]